MLGVALAAPVVLSTVIQPDTGGTRLAEGPAHPGLRAQETGGLTAFATRDDASTPVVVSQAPESPAAPLGEAGSAPSVAPVEVMDVDAVPTVLPQPSAPAAPMTDIAVVVVQAPDGVGSLAPEAQDLPVTPPSVVPSLPGAEGLARVAPLPILVRMPPAAEAPGADMALDETLVGYAEQVELALELNRTERRRLQMGLRLLGHDPVGVDGILEPQSRAAIVAWQEGAGLPATGFVDAGQRERLVAESAAAFDDWQAAQAAAREAAAAQVETASIPIAREAPQCARNEIGTIIENQSFKCDVTVLRESL